MAGKIPSLRQIKTWLHAFRSQQLSKLIKGQAPPIFSFVNYKGGPPRVENYYLSTYPRSSLFMAPHIQKHLQTRDTWTEGLPDLHLAWNGGLGPMDPRWNAFPLSVILTASHLTVGVNDLFDRKQGKVHELPRRMLGWMVQNTKYTSGPVMHLKHLTLVDEKVYDASDFRRAENTAVSNAIVDDFPVIPGLESLELVFMEHPGTILLDKLSQKLKAHNVEFKVTVWAQRWITYN